MKKKVILAYSGGLDTSVILHWLVVKGYDVVCFIADVGQLEDFEQAKEKAYALGARTVYVQNLQEKFVQEYVFQALKANAIYEGRYLLGTALARPLIAQKQIEIAQQEQTTCVAHGATGKGNDQVRFELSYMALMPEVEIIAPWKMPIFLNAFTGRSDLIAYAHKHNIPITSTLEKPYSIDENIMHTSFEGGLLEDPAYQPDEGLYQKTVSPLLAPDKCTALTITFEKGLPTALIDHEQGITITGSLELFNYLNKVGGSNGIGRVDIVENRFVGIKSRGIYETPAGTILYKAHQDLEALVLDKEVQHLKESLTSTIAGLIYNGFWFSPEMKCLMALVDESQQNVDGNVKVTLYKGNCIINGRRSEKSRYKQRLASMDQVGGYNSQDAEGFIKIQGLRLKLGQP